MKRQISQWKFFLLRLRRFFVTTVLGGIVVILPLSIFILLVRFVFDIAINLLAPIRSLLGFSNNVNEWLINLIAFSLVTLLFFLIGLAVRTGFGREIFAFIEENWLIQLPFYGTVRDTVQAFFGNKKPPFSKVVLVDVFGSPTRMTGFVTDEHEGGMITVFVPTGPNPTNGFIFHVKPDQIEYLDVKTEEAMRTIIGVGVGSANLFNRIKLR
ncbi:MAG: hypothetical protein DHS20C18_15020 [Saprospiraceae bacterium]|nr:MAG: hypothetical protein DHS20C18_15020 [Saprospiraceae bacterium]